MSSNDGHIQHLALAEVIDRQRDHEGVLRPVAYSVVNSLKISPSFGPIWYRDLDWGFPSVDDVLTPYGNASGVFDETRYTRERAVSLSVVVTDDWFPTTGTDTWDQAHNSSAYWVRELGRWVVPSGRYRLYWRNTGSDQATYWCHLRGSGMSAPIQMGSRKTRDVQLNWVCPDGKIYLFDESYDESDEPNPNAAKDGRTRHVIKYGGALSPGAPIPITFPFSFPSGNPSNAGVDYRGTVSTGFLARIWAGPTRELVDPRMTVTSPSGEVSVIAFNNLTVPPDQYVEIDTSKMTVLMNGLPTERREGSLTAPLRFPQLQPGFNTIQLNAVTGGADSYIETLHHAAFLA